MAAPKTETVRTQPLPAGFVPGLTQVTFDVVDRTHSTAFAVLHDARGEVRTVVDAGIELVEKTTAALFRMARKLTARIDDAAGETLTGVESLLGGAVKSARDTTKAATDLAHTAIGGVTGGKAVA